MEETPMAIERLLAAIVLEAGGELRVSYDAIVAAHSGEDKFLVMDIVDGGAALALSLADREEVPSDVK